MRCRRQWDIENAATKEAGDQLAQQSAGITWPAQFQRLLQPFSNASAIGFGICDNQLRFQAINHALAASNGVPVAEHLHKTVREVLGGTAGQIEPVLQQVLATDKAALREMSGEVPGRKGMVHWVASYFPVNNSRSKVKCVGAAVVEITELEKLDAYFSTISNHLMRTASEDKVRCAQELHASVGEYDAALMANLSSLTRRRWDLDKDTDEQLESAVQALDDRVMAMRKLVFAVASGFPIWEVP